MRRLEKMIENEHMELTKVLNDAIKLWVQGMLRKVYYQFTKNKYILSIDSIS